MHLRALLSLPAAAMALALALASVAPRGALAAGGLESEMGIINSQRSVKLDPSVQHIPLDATRAHLRPPAPRVPSEFDIFVGLSVFRDGYRCAKTMVTGFKRAAHPERLYFGVVDQVNPGDDKCIVEFCKMAAAEFPGQGACPFRTQVRIDERLADDSRGPTLARHYQQQLLRDEEFCLQLDGHSIFTNDWDKQIVEEWTRVGNEMAVLSTYLHHVHDYVKENGDNAPPYSLPHLCTTIRGGNGMVRNEGASMISGSKWPQLSALWGAGLSFSKCHAERRVLIDSHTLWMFDGEEFLRSSHLWTHGYDLYSPSPLGSVVYHNYSKVPARFEHVKVDQAKKAVETEYARNRFKLVTGQDFVGQVDAREMAKFGFGNVRSFDEYLAFSGVTFKEGEKDKDTCYQLHWVPYSNATDVEQIVGGGWKFAGNAPTANKPEIRTQPDPNGAPEPIEPQGADHHAKAGAGAEGDPAAAALPADAKAAEPIGAAGVPTPPVADNDNLGGLMFYFMIFGGCVYVVMANEGVNWRLGNLLNSDRRHDTRA